MGIITRAIGVNTPQTQAIALAWFDWLEPENI